MKKLKQFYKNNEKTILFGSGVIAGTVVMTHFGQLAVNSVRLADANLYEIAESGKMFLRVSLTNGTTRDYLWDAAKTAA